MEDGDDVGRKYKVSGGPYAALLTKLLQNNPKILSLYSLRLSNVVPLQMSDAMVFISIDGRTRPAEIVPTPQPLEIAKF